MNLRHVPDDEAAAVRELLDAHAIDWYEIAPNRWGVSSGAIWVRDDDEQPRAKALLAQFQAERQRSARANYAQSLRDGSAATLLGVIRDEPLRVLLMLACVVLMLGLAALPVILVGLP